MKSRQRIGIAQTQKLQLNLGLATSIRILGLDAIDLARYLEEQAASNPALRVGPPPDPAPGEWLPRWSAAFDQMRGGTGAELLASAEPSLMAHVTQEITQLVDPGRSYDIAIALAEALEPSGWLGQSLPEIAATTGFSVAELESMLRLLQGIEPTGLFARSLSECLCLQAAEHEVLDRVMAHVLDHLDLVAAGDQERLAARLKVSVTEVESRIRILRRFDPKPGARFAHGAAPLREPDLIARMGEGGWEILLNRSSLPTLKIEDHAPDEETRTHRSRARALARMIEGRNTTMLKVGHEILMRQRAALQHGLAALVPMTMAEIAAGLSMHESTISRVVAGTSVDTPFGTVWLRRLFTGRVGDIQSPAAAEVRAVLRQIIADEDPFAPLSDADLTAALAAHHLPIARRTLSKYRAMMNIPPANRRKRRGPEKTS